MQRRTFLSLATASAVSHHMSAAPSTSSALNGRWDLTVPNSGRKRAWWLEIKGADTPQATGSFIGAPGGDLDQIPSIKVNPDGSAEWTLTRPTQTKPWKGLYKVRLEGDKLTGTLEVEGQAKDVFTGVRAPKFQRQNASAMKPGKPIDLFNGRDLFGWHALRMNTPFLWKVEGSVMKNGPGTTDIVTDAKFMDFSLHVEYKVGARSNSGVGLRGRYEVQILEDYGQPPNTHGNGALYSRILPTSNASKQVNEWQTFDITLVSNIVTVVLNGVKVIDNREVDGLTAMAMDPNEGEPGPIVLQGDHGPVEFRKIVLTPLTRS
ncbi:MAG: DUF1080 domain-containing protein [Bryobacteraceae bacterium]|nr:DUF1080 domain-containing protein [Bryobacteraceae bacterium]